MAGSLGLGKQGYVSSLVSSSISNVFHVGFPSRRGEIRGYESASKKRSRGRALVDERQTLLLTNAAITQVLACGCAEYHDLIISMLRAQFEYTTLSCTKLVPAGNATMSGSHTPDWMRSRTL
jgi:hypothetical protein